MSQKIYVDTNVWLDLYWNRSSRYLELGMFAQRIFERCISCEFIFFVSDTLVVELERFGALELLTPIREKCEFVRAKKEDYRAARRRDVHFPDSLHIVLAEKHGAKVFVTNDTSITSETVLVVQSPAL